ncbi:hypothetical protein, partial [Rubellimicrobium roseum]
MEVDSKAGDLDLFAQLRFQGDRFDHANLPLDVLENVSAYLDVLRELAGEIWREKNPDRDRLPPHFKKSLSLSFRGVEEGSAKARIARDQYAASALPDATTGLDYLLLAQSRFIELAAAANENREVKALPPSIRKPLELLIGGLGAGEQLQLISQTGKDNQQPSVRYSPLTRDRMIGGIGKVASRLRTRYRSQKMTAAASAMADRN